jgi:nucleoside-diphosphate-sugar epimerase
MNNLILMTGATGFLGGAIAVEAIKRGVGQRLLLLVRADDPSQGLARVAENFALLGASAADIAALREEQIVCAGLTELDAIHDDARLNRVSIVIHSAALATFSNHPLLEQTNVGGSYALGKLMHGRPALQRFIYIGTAMACGDNAMIDGSIAEVLTLPIEDNDHLVPYTRSKALGEKILRDNFPDLPLIVTRPSIIVGHTVLGCAPSQSIFWVFLVWQILGIITTDLEDKIDVVPVDWCAEAIMELALKKTLSHQVYHLSAGAGSSRTFREIDVALAAARGVTPLGDGYQRITVEKMDTLLYRVRRRIPDCNARLLLKALKLYGSFAELNYIFRNDNLLAEGIALSTPMPDYIGTCVASARDIPIGDQMQWDFK